jgi:hypothetical protein
MPRVPASDSGGDFLKPNGNCVEILATLLPYCGEAPRGLLSQGLASSARAIGHASFQGKRFEIALFDRCFPQPNI